MGRPHGPPHHFPSMRLPRHLAACAILAAIAFGALHWPHVGNGAPPAGAQETVTVAVGDFFFCDPSLPPGACQTVVSVGDSVVWDYSTGSEGHTVTHCGESCDAPTSTPLWDSGGLTSGQSFSHTFSEPGTYRYLCRFHPDAMRAVVLVEAVATPTEPVVSPTPFPTVERSPTPAPTEPAASPTSSPTGKASPSPTPPAAADEEDDGGVAFWVLVLVGIGGGVLVVGAGVVVVRRFR